MNQDLLDRQAQQDLKENQAYLAMTEFKAGQVILGLLVTQAYQESQAIQASQGLLARKESGAQAHPWAWEWAWVWVEISQLPSWKVPLDPQETRVILAGMVETASQENLVFLARGGKEASLAGMATAWVAPKVSQAIQDSRVRLGLLAFLA